MNIEQRELYLNLLIKVLLNTIYEDPNLHGHKFSAAIRDQGRDWPCLAHTMVGRARLENLKELMQRTVDEGVPGDYIETGVWRGGCCILMRGVLAANLEKSRKVYVADSFAGLPRPNSELYPWDACYASVNYTELAVSLEQVKENFAKYDLLGDQVIFVRGLFKDTLPALQAGPFALIRLDGDYYESTIQALEALYPKVSQGGFVVIDDYGIASCREAVNDYRRLHNIDEPLSSVDWTGVWWQKGALSAPIVSLSEADCVDPMS